MAVPLYNQTRQYEMQRPDIDAAIARVISSGRFDWGDEVPAFEAEFAAHNGATHAVTVNSGTAALKVALLALGVGPGDEVVTVANTDVAGSSAIRHVGAVPVWVDIDPDSRTIDLERLEAAVTAKTRAIIPVDIFGHPSDMVSIMALAGRHGLPVIEDACLALGARIGERKLGTFATVTCFSFAPSKHLGSYGSGGCCLTEDADLAEMMKKLSAYGQHRSRHRSMYTLGGVVGLHHETDGLNERLDEIQAAILRAKLPDLDRMLAERHAQAALYAEGLDGLGLDLPQTKAGCSHAWRNYVIECDNRDELATRLAAKGIATSISYAPPMHVQPVYLALGTAVGSLPITERSCLRLLGLPIGPQLTREQISEVIAAVRASV